MKIYVAGHPVEITQEIQCTRSDTSHRKLVQDARVDRQRRNFDVDESYVLCTRCVKALPLKI